MLLALRTLPFLIAVTAAVGAMALFWFPTRPFLVMAAALLSLFFLLAKLVNRPFRKIEFWSFLALPMILSASAFSLLLFVEGSGLKILIIALTTFLVWLFAENLFAYLHLSGAYQVNALEYLSLVISVISVFFFTTTLFALRLFFGFPLWLIVPFFAAVIFVLFAAVLWLCKIEKEKITPNAVGAVVILSEFFLGLAFLPSGFFSNAALLTLIFYLFLGIIRASLLKRLNSKILKRYLLAAGLIALLIILTARWT